MGQIAPVAERLERRLDKSAGPDGCWIWTGYVEACGYGMIRHNGETRRAHRVAYELATGTDPGGLCVLHSCDNPPCCNPSHLRSGTHAENMAERNERGRSAVLAGTLNGRAKVTEADVELIRIARSLGETTTSLAARYGVSKVAISKMCRRITWRHVA